MSKNRQAYIKIHNSIINRFLVGTFQPDCPQQPDIQLSMSCQVKSSSYFPITDFSTTSFHCSQSLATSSRNNPFLPSAFLWTNTSFEILVVPIDPTSIDIQLLKYSIMLYGIMSIFLQHKKRKVITSCTSLVCLQ